GLRKEEVNMLTRHSTIRQLGTLAAAIGAVIGFARPGYSVLIPGGGNAKSDCYAEFDVQGATGSNKVTCTEGDPTCDTGPCGDNQCTFSVKACVNQTNLEPGCTPVALKKPAKAQGGLSAPAGTDGLAACSSPLGINVHLKGGKKNNKKGIKRIKFTAIGTGHPAR